MYQEPFLPDKNDNAFAAGCLYSNGESIGSEAAACQPRQS